MNDELTPTGIDLGLAGRHLLVTGAGGLGEQLAIEALRLGMKVSVVDRDEAALRRLDGHDSLHLVVADLTDVTAHDDIVAQAAERLGPITAFVPTAAVIRRQHDVSDITEDDWDFQHSVNLKAVWFSTRAAAEHMKAHGQGGAVVLVSSGAGITGGVAGTTVYGAAKGGVLSIAHGFARMYGRHGIRVNAVLPGSMDTPMLWVGQSEATAARVADVAVLKRIGQPIEMARPILFLLSDWASFIVGVTLDIDGGSLMR